MKRGTRPTAPPWVWFVAWSLVGVGWMLAVVGAFTIGPVVAPVVFALTVWLATRPQSNEGLPGLLAGLSAPLFYVAYLNREGPGTICTMTANGGGCTEHLDPWPWFTVGSVLLLVGVAAFALTQRRSAA